MLGVSEEHVALHGVASRWVERNVAPEVPRSYLDGDPNDLPPFWSELAELGWLGLHLPVEVGGSGYGLAEVAVVLEELGRACAPGPFLPTVIVSAVLDAFGEDSERARWLPGLADGSLLGGIAMGSIVLGGTDVVVSIDASGWFVEASPPVVPVAPVDPTRATWAMESSGTTRRRAGDAAALAIALISAECSGGAAWCVQTAAEYARVREQFGRPIGQFQGVKHRCADMLVALERARAVAWDAVRPGGSSIELAAAIAGAVAPEAFFQNAKDCIQVLGGIGFTWEHDAHIYLKRAVSVLAMTGGHHSWSERVVTLASSGARRSLDLELPAEAEPIRRRVRAELVEITSHDRSEWRELLAERGYLAPHWPAPWGRGAAALEQLVIDEELRHARVRRPHLQIGGWVLPTLIEHGTPEQQQRFIPPTLRGELSWCQLFSEPGAGSDLASLCTKASRVDGGWLLSGQKVWTSLAREADWGLCLARTDPSVPKHEGITCFLLDMASDGIEIRPLRELTGLSMFNEVFLTDVFVPDEMVVGHPGDGWRAGRTTLANERVSIASGSSFGPGAQMLLACASDRAGSATTDRAADVGVLLAEAHSLAVMGLRSTARAVAGADPGPESSVRKLLGAEHDQRVQELGMRLHGASAIAVEGEAAAWISGFLANRCLTIAGGTSEVQRNVVAERLLGLPKDP